MAHNYTQVLDSGKFTIRISPSTNYGYFEHTIMGEDCGGGLWFDGNELTDYDGVFELPKTVAQVLVQAGYHLEPEFFQ
jgi:hypothetical protein